MYSTYSRYSYGAVLPQSPTPYPSFSHYFGRKATSFVHLVIDKWYPFHILTVDLCIPFNCCKYTISYEPIRKQEGFLDFFKAEKYICKPFWAFLQTDILQIFVPFHTLQLVKTLPFTYLNSEKRTPFGRSQSPCRP